MEFLGTTHLHPIFNAMLIINEKKMLLYWFQFYIASAYQLLGHL
jgi:hypothetical protein